MQLPIPDRRFGLRFNITPLIDVVFLLIIFFLVSSHFVRSETAQEVELPEASQAQDDVAADARRLLITVTVDGRYHIAGRVVAAGDLREIFNRAKAQADGQLEIRIRGDRRVPYRQIEPLLLLCSEIGLTDVKFGVMQSGRS